MGPTCMGAAWWCGGGGGRGAATSGFVENCGAPPTPAAKCGGGGGGGGGRAPFAEYAAAMGDICTIVVLPPAGASSLPARPPMRHAAHAAAAPQKQHAMGATTKMRITKMTLAATAPGGSGATCAPVKPKPPKDAVEV